MEKIKNYIDQNKDRFIAELMDILRIPSVSADSKYKADVLKAAEFIKKSFFFTAPVIFNSLPSTAKDCKSLDTFKNSIKVFVSKCDI